jgi:hypothetical protein
LLLGDGLGNFGGHFIPPTIELSYSGPGSSDLVSGDFNSDAKQDLIVRMTDDYYDETWEFLGNGDGSFYPRGSFPFNYYSGRPAAFAADDFNRDGYLDLLVSFLSSPALVYLGGGNGLFYHAPPSPLPTGPRTMVTGDFNGDGIVDLAFPCGGCLTVGGEHAVLLSRGIGDGTFDYGPPAIVSQNSVDTIAADFNRDGKLDLAVTTAGTVGVSLLLGNGDLTFSEQSFTGLSEIPASFTSGDFNGDGAADIALILPTIGEVVLLINDGTGEFSSASFNVGGSPRFLQVGDFNGDSDLDVVTLDRNSTFISILLGRGDGTLDPPQHYLAGVEPRKCVTGDFNDDGRLDLAVANHESQEVSILLNQGPFPTCHDEDGDGFGSPGNAVCSQGSRLDCDDTRASVFPKHEELCDGLDNDCDSQVDEGYFDEDADRVADCVDDCWLIWNPNQTDGNGDHIGDACEGSALFADANLSTAGFSSNRVDGRDLVVFADAFGACPGDAAFNSAANLDHAPASTGPPRSCVGPLDFHLFMEQFAEVH